MEDITFSDVTLIADALSSDFNSECTANDARAKSAWFALLAYANKGYGNASYEPVEQGIRDLLGDLQHLCVVLDFDFSQLFARSKATFEDELASPLG